MKKQLLLLIILVGTCINTSAQTNEKFVGAKAMIGKAIYGDVVTNVGVFYEHQFAKYFAYNFGMDYTRRFNSFMTPYTSNYISIPVNMKFVSKYINVGLGLYLDYYAGVYIANGVTVENFSANEFFFGASLQLSKDIQLTKHFTIEPEVALSHIISYDYLDLKLGLRLKYRIPEKFKPINR